MAKILFLQEYIRENHMKKKDGVFKNVFFQTKGGQLLKSLIEDKSGLGLTKKDYYMDYAYNLVPKVISRDNYERAIKYKPPTQAEAKVEYEHLYARILEEKPDIIIPSGNIGCKGLLKQASISALRGKPEQITVESNGESFTTWVLPMFSMEYMLMNPNVQNLIEADFITLSKFLRDGEKAFHMEVPEYEFVTDINRVREIFSKDVKEAPIVAWDLETNTLRPELKGAKTLVISLSMKEGEGCTIPLDHKDTPFTPEEIDEIYELIRVMLADPDIINVGHHIQL